MRQLLEKRKETFTPTEASDDKIYAYFDDRTRRLCIATKDNFYKDHGFKFVVLREITEANSYAGPENGFHSLTELLEWRMENKNFPGFKEPLYEFDSVPELLKWAIKQYIKWGEW